MDDAALVRAAQRGDRDAFSALVTRHASSILGLTTRMLGPAADAEDVAQETFVAAYKALSRFQFESKFSTWLYRIAVNKCTDALRARRPDISLDEADDQSATMREIADEETPHWALEQAELAWELDKSIQALPHVYRQSFVLRHIEGLGYDEMSAILGVHRDTLKMRVYKARNLLCQALAHLNSGVV
jgi:RNA polymerase sigma-70 factor (ECF subfamily)